MNILKIKEMKIVFLIILFSCMKTYEQKDKVYVLKSKGLVGIELDFNLRLLELLNQKNYPLIRGILKIIKVLDLSIIDKGVVHLVKLDLVDIIEDIFRHSDVDKEYKDSLIHFSIVSQSQKVMKFLLKNESSIYEKDKDGKNILECAILSDNVDAVRILMEYGIWRSDFLSYLKLAIKRGNLEIIKIFLQRNNNHFEFGRTSLMFLTSHANDRVIIEAFNSDDINKKDINGHTALMLAVHLDNEVGIDFLLDKNADLNLVDSNGCNILNFAAAVGNINVIRKLLDRGLNKRALNNFLTSSIMIYIDHYHNLKHKNYLEVLDLLFYPEALNIEEGSNKNNLLLFSIQRQFKVAVEYFLNKGATLYSNGESALEVAKKNKKQRDNIINRET